MKKGLKKALGLLVALSLMVVGSAFSALAADSPEQRQTFSVDLNNFDESQPYSETLHFEKDGQPVTVTLSYTPPLTRDPATEGTWKSDAFWVSQVWITDLTYQRVVASGKFLMHVI